MTIFRNFHFSFINLIFFVAGLAILGIFGKGYSLQCTHHDPAEVVCVKKTAWMGLISLGEETLRNVRGAKVEVMEDDDGDAYRVTLITRFGDVPLQSYYDGSSGKGSYEETAAKINNYVRESGDEVLEISGSIFSYLLPVLVGGVFMVVGFPLKKREY